FFLASDPPPPPTYTLSLHDALPISPRAGAAPHRALAGRPAARARHRGGDRRRRVRDAITGRPVARHHPRGGTVRVRSRAHHRPRSEEHTSELQSLRHLVCRLLLEKK